MGGRVKSWVKRAVSYMRNYFGIRNKTDVEGIKKDIVRIIGGKVISGKIPTDYLSLSNQLKVKYQTGETPSGKRIIKTMTKDVEDRIQEARDTYRVSDKKLKEIELDVLGKGRTLSSKDLTGEELVL